MWHSNVNSSKRAADERCAHAPKRPRLVQRNMYHRALVEREDARHRRQLQEREIEEKEWREQRELEWAAKQRHFAQKRVEEAEHEDAEKAQLMAKEAADDNRCLGLRLSQREQV